MTEEHQLPSDSDEDDEDYVPEAAVDSVSEAESEGEAESGQDSENDENKRRAKRRRKGKTKRIEKKSSEKVVVEEEVEEEKKLTEEEEKKRADSLWADFMKDTGTNTSGPSPQAPKLDSKPNEKIKVTKVFEFAGEEIKVEKEVPINSTEAITTCEKTEAAARPARGRGVKRGGISSLLGQLGKRAKISTLEKSKLDWDNYKKQENLEEEISTHNRGKGGYLERQDFLQRADLRQFEIEKQMRSASRRNR